MDEEDRLEIWERGKKFYNLLHDHLEYYGIPGNTKDEIETFISDMSNSRRKYAYDYTPEGNSINIVFSDIELPGADTVEQSAEFLDESYNFEREGNPKSSMGIGVANIIPEITSDDLGLLAFGWDYDKQEFSDEEFKKEYFFREDTDQDRADIFIRVKKIALVLNGKIRFHHGIFDWKEEDKMHEFILSNPNPEYPFIYDAHNVDMDDWQIVWSKVPLPSSGEIHIPVNESNFEREIEPKKAMGIGHAKLIKSIDSEDLEMFSDYSDGNEVWEEEFRENRLENYDDPEEYETDLRKVKSMYDILKGKIEFGEFFDHREFGSMSDWVENNSPGDKSFMYNAYPGGDGISLFSSVELPSAEEVDPYEYS